MFLYPMNMEQIKEQMFTSAVSGDTLTVDLSYKDMDDLAFMMVELGYIEKKQSKPETPEDKPEVTIVARKRFNIRVLDNKYNIIQNIMNFGEDEDALRCSFQRFTSAFYERKFIDPRDRYMTDNGRGTGNEQGSC